MTPRDIILAGAAAFEQCPELWTQRADHRNKRGRKVKRCSHADGDSYCMVGIVRVLIGPREFNVLSTYLMPWNDAPGRTVEEVIAKMREIAGKL